jgi:hypothetical protein
MCCLNCSLSILQYREAPFPISTWTTRTNAGFYGIMEIYTHKHLNRASVDHTWKAVYVTWQQTNKQTNKQTCSLKLPTYHMPLHRSNRCSLLCYHRVDEPYSILHLNGMHIHQGICYSSSHLNLTCSPLLHYNAESHCWNNVSLDPCTEFHLDQSMATL